MKVEYSRLVNGPDSDSPNYWQYFGRRLANLAAIPEGATVLDIGTGSGSVLIPAAQKNGAHGLGVGVDLHLGGLKEAQSEIKTCGSINAALAQMDARDLGFVDGCFDWVLSGFVGWDDCFNFDRLDFTGVDNMLEDISCVLKPGGGVGISSWVSQDDLDWLGRQFQKHLPAFSAEQGIGSSWIAYSKENLPGFEMILQAMDFQDIAITTETEVFVSADEETWWQQMWGSGWWVQIDRVARDDADQLRRFKEQVFEDLQEYKYQDGIRFSKTVLFAFGRKG